jgi:ubiquinone/menaquinone biosynthesis C-methylase UbiE
MHDSDLVFRLLQLKAGDTFLDMGCGPGEYAVQASKIVGDTGTVYALDKWKYLIDALIKEADSQGLMNIKAIVADITEPLPIENTCVDVCLLATVLHTLNMAKDGANMMGEIRRVLKPSGRLAILNCKKEDQPFGPVLRIRWSPEEVEDFLTKYGFEKVDYVDLGFNYMIQFRFIRQVRTSLSVERKF